MQSPTSTPPVSASDRLTHTTASAENPFSFNSVRRHRNLPAARRTQEAISPTSFEHTANVSHLRCEGRGLRATRGGGSLVCFSRVFLSSRRPPVELPSMGSWLYSLVFTLRLAPLREEVVTSLVAVRAVIARGRPARRTASTDWNDRSCRSHSVFRVVIESRERGDTSEGRQTPGLPSRPPTSGGPRLQSIGGRSRPY